MSIPVLPPRSLSIRVRERFFSRHKDQVPHFVQLPDPAKTDRVLFFAPHPDDEALAAGGYLRRATAAGASCRIVLVTDGNRRGLKAIRAQEFQDVLNALGIQEDGKVELNYCNGGLPQENQGLVQAALQQEIERYRPTIVISPHPADLHREHKVVSQIVYDLYKQQPDFILLEYLIHYPPYYPWPRKFAPESALLPPRNLVKKGTWACFPLTGKEVQEKKRVVEMYSSQLKTPVLRSLMYSLIRMNELFCMFPSRKR